MVLSGGSKRAQALLLVSEGQKSISFGEVQVALGNRSTCECDAGGSWKEKATTVTKLAGRRRSRAGERS